MGEQRGNRSLVIGVVAGVALAAALGSLLVSKPQTTTAREPPRPPDAIVVSVAAAPVRADAGARARPIPPSPAPIAPRVDDGVPAHLMAPTALVQRFQDARRRMLSSARACATPGKRGSSEESVSFQYRLVVEAGFARIADLETMSSSIEDFALQQCILDNVRGLRWATEAEEGSVPVQERLAVAEIAPP